MTVRLLGVVTILAIVVGAVALVVWNRGADSLITARLSIENPTVHEGEPVRGTVTLIISHDLYVNVHTCQGNWIFLALSNRHVKNRISARVSGCGDDNWQDSFETESWPFTISTTENIGCIPNTIGNEPPAAAQCLRDTSTSQALKPGRYHVSVYVAGYANRDVFVQVPGNVTVTS